MHPEGEHEAPAQLVGHYRRFGPFGPLYEIVAIRQTLTDGDTLLHVRLPENDEEVDVRYSQVIQDPEAD